MAEQQAPPTAPARTAVPVRYEVIPLPGTRGRVLEHLDPSWPVTVTSSPAHGWEATVELAEELARDGRSVVPHLAARQIPFRATVARVVDRLVDAGVEEVFAVGGDAVTPAGPFIRSADLIGELAARAAPLRIGVGGYPEGHPYLTEAESFRGLLEVQPHVDRVVTQMCFDPAAVRQWLVTLRERGIELPVDLGVPAPVTTARLLRIGSRIGVGTSLRLLRHQRRDLRTLLTPGAFDTAALVGSFEPLLRDPAFGVQGLHLFTFNALAESAQWGRDQEF